MESVRGLIFDLDGTLLESMGLWYSLGERYLQGRGVRGIPPGLQDLLGPMDMMQSAVYLKDRFELPDEPQDIIRGIEQLLEDQYWHHITLKPGTADFLAELAGSGRFRMGIATATARHLVEPALKRLGIAAHFEFILTTDEIGVGKHEPDIYLEALRLLDCSLKETVVFEDALYAVITAKKAGFRVVAVADGEAEKHRHLVLEAADVFVERIGDAAKLLTR